MPRARKQLSIVVRISLGADGGTLLFEIVLYDCAYGSVGSYVKPNFCRYAATAVFVGVITRLEVVETGALATGIDGSGLTGEMIALILGTVETYPAPFNIIIDFPRYTVTKIKIAVAPEIKFLKLVADLAFRFRRVPKRKITQSPNRRREQTKVDCGKIRPYLSPYAQVSQT